MCALPDNGVLGSLVKEESVKRIQVKDGKVHFNDKLVFDVTPMIGASLYFPVFHDGALFSLGDVHAAMGDGEVMVSGVEISAEVKVRLSVIKGISIETPMLENEEICGVIYSHEEIEKAIFHAVRIMNERVQKNLGLSLNEAGMLLSAVGDLRFCQVVDPERTVMMCIPKKIMKSLF